MAMFKSVNPKRELIQVCLKKLIYKGLQLLSKILTSRVPTASSQVLVSSWTTPRLF